MKKIKKPKLLPQACLRFGGIFKAHAKDLKNNPTSFDHVADVVRAHFQSHPNSQFL